MILKQGPFRSTVYISYRINQYILLNFGSLMRYNLIKFNVWFMQILKCIHASEIRVTAITAINQQFVYINLISTSLQFPWFFFQSVISPALIKNEQILMFKLDHEKCQFIFFKQIYITYVAHIDFPQKKIKYFQLLLNGFQIIYSSFFIKILVSSCIYILLKWQWKCSLFIDWRR